MTWSEDASHVQAQVKDAGHEHEAHNLDQAIMACTVAEAKHGQTELDVDGKDQNADMQLEEAASV